ncbi:MAG: M48 family metalloprotease [Myxococcota bacterium]
MIALALATCAANRSLAANPDADTLRARLTEEANQAEAKLREGGMVVSDPELAAYLASVASPLLALAPDSSLPLRIAVLRDPTVNAFALPNGAIYVNIGALARVEDEAQLALLLAQKMNHIALDHTTQIAADRRSKTVAAKLTQVALAPLLGLSDIAFAAAMAGYSREREEEADRAGMEWVARAGFETRAAPRLFAVLDEGDRQVRCEELVASGAVAANANGRNDAAALRTAVAPITLESVRLSLALREYGLARDGAQLAIARYGESARLRADEGEALLGTAQAPAELPRELRARGRNQRDREEADTRELARLVARANEPLPDAEQSFRRALALDSTYGPARRGLGEVLLRRGDVAGGTATLSEYLAAHPDAVDARLVEGMLRRIRTAASPAP